MVTTTRTRVEGLRELGEAMRLLSNDIALKVARQATAAAARPVKKAAIRNIERNPSIDTGSLHDSVIIKAVPKGEREFTSEHIVTVRGRGKKRPYTVKGQRIENAPHAHFVEFGTVNMPAEPFLAPALMQEKDAATQAMKDKLAQRIAKVKS